MSSDADIVLSVRNVSKCFEMYEKPVHRLYQTLCAGKKKFYKEFWALRDINFDVHRGECVGIIGRNGAGKSTLLQIVTGTLAPTTGEVKLKGRVAALLELGSGFNPEFTGRENVYLNGTILGLSQQEITARYDEIVAFADIGEFIDQPVKTYSSGMMVRLAFAVQVMVDPDVLIVDEALAVGDSAFQRKCYARMDELKAKGVTILLVSHDTESVKQQCSRVIVLDRGAVVYEGEALAGVTEYMRRLFPHEFGSESESHQVQDKLETEKRRLEDGYVLSVSTRNPGEYRFGVSLGDLTDIIVYGLQPPNILQTPGNVVVDVHCHWDRGQVRAKIDAEGFAANINVGCGIKDRKNELIFGTNTYLQNVFIDPFAMSSAIVRFSFAAPELPTGDYFVHASVQLGVLNNAVDLDWGEKIVKLAVDAGKYVPGVVGVETQVTVL